MMEYIRTTYLRLRIRQMLALWSNLRWRRVGRRPCWTLHWCGERPCLDSSLKRDQWRFDPKWGHSYTCFKRSIFYILNYHSYQGQQKTRKICCCCCCFLLFGRYHNVVVSLSLNLSKSYSQVMWCSISTYQNTENFQILRFHDVSRDWN